MKYYISKKGDPNNYSADNVFYIILGVIDFLQNWAKDPDTKSFFSNHMNYVLNRS